MVKSVQMLDNFTRRLSIQLIPIYNKMEKLKKEKQIFFYVIKNYTFLTIFGIRIKMQL